jgi:hypothetical protein
VKKLKANPDKPAKQANGRIIVRPECLPGTTARRNANKDGGYPKIKKAPLIKCTGKGPAGTKKLKPNGRRYGSSKLKKYQDSVCVAE